MKKRIISLVLVGVLTLSILGGCGKKEIPLEESTTESTYELIAEEGAQLKFRVGGGKLEYGESVAKAFEEEYGVPVEVEEAGMDIVNKMTLDGPSGNGADVFMASHDAYLTAKDAGLLLKLNDQIEESVRDDVNEIAVETVETDGDLYGVPVTIECYAMLYIKDLVQGEPAETMEQIIEEAKLFNNPAENKFWYLSVVTEAYNMFPFLSVDGFKPFGEDGKNNDDPGFKTPEFLKALERVRNLNELIPVKADDLKIETITQLEQNFIDGKTAYYFIGPWLIKTLKEQNTNFGVSTLPTMDGKQMKTMAGVQNAYVSSYSEYPNAAQLFAEYLVSEEGAEILYEKAYNVTARKNIENINGLKDDDALKVYTEAFDDAVPMPQVKRISYYWTTMQSVLSAVFDGKITPEEGAKKAQDDFEALVASE